MFVRAIGNYPPYRDGWCGEVPDRIGGPLVGSILEVVPRHVVLEYAQTMVAIDFAIEQRINADLRENRAESAQKFPTAMPARGGKRVITGAQWKRELGQKSQDIAADVESILCATRDMGMSPNSLDDDQRTIDLTAATDTPIRRRVYDVWGDESIYDEILDMSPGAVRLERLNKGAPLLDSHNYYAGTQAIIGAIVPGSAMVRAGKLAARAKFSRSQAGERAFQDARDGILRAVSIGFLIHKMEIDDDAEPPVHRVIDWEPHEVSAVAIPADKNAGFRDAQIALAS